MPEGFLESDFWSGGRITICVVCYGPHAGLARRFLESLYRFTDPGRFTVRAGLNEVEEATISIFRDYSDRFGNIDIFQEPRNIFKVPLMRRMFRERPIETPWVIWFDDDSHVTRPDWLARLGLKVQAHPEVDQWGSIFCLWRQDEAIREFIERAPWYRGVPLKRSRGPDGREGYEFRFATGGFWALRTELIDTLDWPDARTRQGHEDFLLGEALRQQGHLVSSFEYGVAINQAERRNSSASEIHQLEFAPLW